ncbi:MAG: hypothetical protein QOH68_4118 [Nocardioidaceae bacterium]|jgi:hypothetical protein|nr:hypothetical protein [Nocardioidaceae bacterium]
MRLEVKSPNPRGWAIARFQIVWLGLDAEASRKVLDDSESTSVEGEG